jgi:hypothetical protein
MAFTPDAVHSPQRLCGYMVFRGGHIVIMEFKALGKPLRLQQKRERERLLDAGIYVHVIDRADRGIAVLRAYD